jgi:hypothetical protein
MKESEVNPGDQPDPVSTDTESRIGHDAEPGVESYRHQDRAGDVIVRN